jgi:hypothetical protein
MPTKSTPPPNRHQTAAVYRRRRAVAGSIVAGLLALAGLVGGDVLLGPGDVPASAAGAHPLSPRRIVVARPGDSLWSIAEAQYAYIAGSNSVSLSDYVDALVDLNDGTHIEVGQRVLLP